MMVTFISQCEKKALDKTRRVLDAFANRIGDNTWQTVITEEGLIAVKKLLRKTASKNTAVSCHWIRSRSRSELIWVVGNRSKFNSEGVVPVNYTESEMKQYLDSEQWKTLSVIKYASAIAGLFHDFGKANQLFQNKINPSVPKKDKNIFEPYRHEWVSMRLFQCFVGTKKDDEWLISLSEIEKNNFPECFKDGTCDASNQNHPLSHLPPFAQLVAWLILTHHKLPVYPGWLHQYSNKPALSDSSDWFEKNFSAIWNSPHCEDPDQKSLLSENWTFKNGLPVESIQWRSRACEIASAAKVELQQFLNSNSNWLHGQTFTTHISRLCLMLADHYYSSLSEVTEKWRNSHYNVYANTTKDKKAFKQQLDEHLIGVAHHAEKITKALPCLNGSLQQLEDVSFLEEEILKNKKISESDKKNFGWQDAARKEAQKIGKDSIKQGFFGINMASTGKGKTLANAKIMYALGSETGRQRFSVALGLRALTLQTGKEFKEKLKLNDEQLAILVGGVSIKQLFENEQKKLNENDTESESEHFAQITGSESQEALIDADLYLDYKGKIQEHSLSSWTQQEGKGNQNKLEQMLNAPVLVSTIDHLMPATEGTKGGKQIAPILRLLTSDLVLDEPDDFGLTDLPALCRLVNWAGMLGSRVLLSTATMPPALAYALFQSYFEGWKQYVLANFENWDQKITCAWFDEFYASSGTYCFDNFKKSHEEFIQKRIQKLKAETQTQRKGRIVLIAEEENKNAVIRLAKTIHENLICLHKKNHQTKDGKNLSVGLVRMANINPLVAVAKELIQLDAPENTEIHYCIYHSRYPLGIRHFIESQLDKVLKRKDPEKIWKESSIAQKLNSHPEKTDHIFVVLASPIAEVGRDHDYDWAIVEPSSMRSIIQLAGRVLRHRQDVPEEPNIVLLNQNYKSLVGKKPCFERPGFEFGRIDAPQMAKQCLSEILKEENYKIIDATTRIEKPESYDFDPLDQWKFNQLIHLEHRALAYALVEKKHDKPIAANVWWKSQPHWCGELQRQQRFRESVSDEAYYLWLENENYKPKWQWKNEAVKPFRFGVGAIQIHTIGSSKIAKGLGSDFWFSLDAKTIYSKLANDFEMNLPEVSRHFGEVRLISFEKKSTVEFNYFPELGLFQDEDEL